MSLMYAKAVPLLNASSPTNAIAAIISSSTTAASRATTSTVASNIGGPMREEAMDVVVAKIISLLILTILSVLCGLLPLRLLIHTPQLFTLRRSSVDYFLCCLRLFSGGIYLATCFLHLMPDTREKMAAVMLNLGSSTSYAVPELLIMSGFYAVIFVEQIIQVLYVKAQKSDVNRNHRKTTKSKVKSVKEVKAFPSTLDEDVNRDHRGGSDDEEDDDEYNNVLIDDEDDLSFKDQDSDRKSLDSVTQMKEGVSEQSFDAAKPAVVINSTHVQQTSSHCNNVGLKHPLQQQHFMNHSKPSSYSDVGTLVMKNITRSAFDVLSKSPSCDIKPYQNCQPPVIHAQIQQIPVLNSMKQNNHIQKHQTNHVNHHQQNHQQHRQQCHQEQQPNCRSSISPPPQQPHATFHQVHQAQKQIIPLRDSPIPRQGRQYPTVTQSSDEESTDNPDEESDVHNSACRVSVCVEGASDTGGDTVTPVSGDTSQDRDPNLGAYNTGRDCEIIESCSYALTPSKEVSFDRISESSSMTQDIQVRRVVDELSRTDDSSRAHFRSIIYIMALSFHGIFEGMALGLQSMKSSAWSLCFAIVVHRCVLAFKLGMDLCRGDEKQGTTFLCIGMFTLISTLGIIIGILISSGASLYSDVTVPEAILQSLSTGTIFYIVFFDILFKDLEGKEYLKRVSCSFVGFSLMAIVFAIIRS